MRRAVLAVAVLAACGDDGDRGAVSRPEPPPTLVTPVDAAMTDGGVTVITGYDPTSGMHLDEDDDGPPTRSGGGSPRSRRTLEIVLRSSPSGATAVVDGQVVGKTPAYWEGEFTGREREFTFVLPGHALARYRFVPIANGIVHAKLLPVLSDPGALLPIVIPPPATPSAGKRPAPRVVDAAEAEAVIDAGGGDGGSGSGSGSDGGSGSGGRTGVGPAP